MAETKKVILQDASGNSLMPKTLAGLVVFDDGTTLAETIESLEGVSYSLEKAATATDGYSSSYYLTKDGTQVGETINIPKDLVVESGSVKTVETADDPVEGYAVGDKYIDLVLANSDDQHIYILVSDLVDTYTAGNGVVITGNSIAIDTDVVAVKSTTLSGYGIADAYTKTEVDSAIAAAVAGAVSFVEIE